MSSTFGDPYDVIPVIEAEESARVAFMRQIGLYTLGSLLITGLSAVVMMGAVVSLPILQNQIASLVIMLGGIYGAQFVGTSMTMSESGSTRLTGYLLASALSGAALSYLLLTAVQLGAAQSGNPLAIIGQAGGLTALTVVGMVVYLLSGPRNLSFVGAGLSMLTLPMLGLMAITWIFPVGGTIGLVISGVFIVISAGGLLYSLNQVLHEYSTNMVLAGATRVSIGIVVLFWNILVFLMRMTSRD